MFSAALCLKVLLLTMTRNAFSLFSLAVNFVYVVRKCNMVSVHFLRLKSFSVCMKRKICPGLFFFVVVDSFPGYFKVVAISYFIV